MRRFLVRLNKDVQRTFTVRFSGAKNKSPHNYDTIVEVTTPCRGDAYDEAYQHYWNMWKDNTIIEEEKKEFERNFTFTAPANEGAYFYKVRADATPENIKSFLTTAMQRAYEAGESEQRERLLGEVKGMKTNLSARARGDDFISQIAIKEVQKHEWSYNQALDAVIEKIKQ